MTPIYDQLVAELDGGRAPLEPEVEQGPQFSADSPGEWDDLGIEIEFDAGFSGPVAEGDVPAGVQPTVSAQ